MQSKVKEQDEEGQDSPIQKKIQTFGGEYVVQRYTEVKGKPERDMRQ